MATEAFVIIGIVGLIAIFFIKLWNVLKTGRAYEPHFIYVGMAVAFILWMLMFFSFSAAISAEDTAVIQDGNSTITVVQNTNQYVGLLPFLNLSNLLMLVCFLFTVVETILLANTSVIQRQAGPRQREN